MAWSRRRSGVLAIAFLLAGCGSGKDPVQQRLLQLEEAAEARDATAFGEGLSPSFRAGGLNRLAALGELRRYFTLYESVSLELYGVEAERTEGRASVRCVVAFSGQGKALRGLDKLLPPEAAYRFQLELADEGGTWLVSSATWEVVTPSPPA